jgi:hypothetical protein
MKNDLEFANMLELADEFELNEFGLNDEERREVGLPAKIDDNKKCLNCGKPINGLPYNPKFCSTRCGRQFRDAKRKFFTENTRGKSDDD